jgi:hypothetical protein
MSAIHGVPYTGPNLDKEIAGLRGLLREIRDADA